MIFGKCFVRMYRIALLFACITHHLRGPQVSPTAPKWLKITELSGLRPKPSTAAAGVASVTPAASQLDLRRILHKVAWRGAPYAHMAWQGAQVPTTPLNHAVPRRRIAVASE